MILIFLEIFRFVAAKELSSAGLRQPLCHRDAAGLIIQ